MVVSRAPREAQPRKAPVQLMPGRQSSSHCTELSLPYGRERITATQTLHTHTRGMLMPGDRAARIVLNYHCCMGENVSHYSYTDVAYPYTWDAYAW